MIRKRLTGKRERGGREGGEGREGEEGGERGGERGGEGGTRKRGNKIFNFVS